MANSLSHNTALRQRRAPLLRLLLQAVSLRRQRSKLADMSDAQLKDIGITRTQAEVESRRKAWDAPNFWLS